MDTIKIIQHNVLHWETRKMELIATYRMHDPDIILINSHGASEEENIKIVGYSTYMRNQSGERNDGSAILVKQNIKHKIDEEYITDVLCIKILTSLGHISIATTYLPPRRPYLPFPDIHRLSSKNEPTYLLADLNAKHRLLGDSHNNVVGKGLERFLLDNKLHHLGPNFPTYITPQSATTPDIIICNNRAYHNIKTEPGPLTSSDHTPIIMTITSRAIRENVPTRLRLNGANWQLFKDQVTAGLQGQEDDEEPEGDIEKIDRKLEKWYTIMDKAMNMAIPKTKSRTLAKPIINNKIRHIQKAFQRLHRIGTYTGWNIRKYNAYKHLKQRLVSESRQCHYTNWQNNLQYLIDNHKQPKQFWKKLKELKSHPNRTPTYLSDDQNNKIFDNKNKEKVFRDIWEKVFKISEEENLDFDEEHEELVHQYLRDNIHRTQPFETIDHQRYNEDRYLERKIRIDELKNIIKGMKNNAPGISMINKKILTETPDEALEFLTRIFNDTLSLGYFPDKFKQGIINLIPKANKSLMEPINYRPITLLEVPGKILERIINKKVKFFIQSQDILPSSQHGFREKRGTGTALAITTELIAQAAARRDQCFLVLRDVSKAFDKVWHQGLQFKILGLGLPNHLERILCDYLADRKARIRVGDTLGPEIELQSGVPQGGILSPTLYTIYTRDLPPPAIDCHDILYADDISQIITYRGKSKLLMADRVGREIERVNKFEKKWKIRTNMTKFTLIPLAAKKTKDVIADGELLEFAGRGKILGMSINTQGYNKHVSDTVNKGKRALSELYKFKNLPSKLKLHLIRAYVLPILEYPVIPIATCSKAQLLKIQTIQNSALRFAYDERFPFQRDTKTLHELSNLEAINVRLHKRATQIWETLDHLQDPIYIQLKDEHNDRSHSWFPSSMALIEEQPPQPIYTR